MTNRERRILRGEPITPKTLDEKSIKEAVTNAKDSCDIAFTADVTTDPTKPTAATTESFSEAVQAHKNGKILRAALDFGDGKTKYGTLLQYDPTADAEAFAFAATAIISDALYYVLLVWGADGPTLQLIEVAS